MKWRRILLIASMKKTLNKALRAFSILLVCAVPVFGQEFNCQVKIEAIQIETTERRVFSEVSNEKNKTKRTFEDK